MATNSLGAKQPTQQEVAHTVQRSEQTALATAKRNLHYLFYPSNSASSPTRTRTRALRRSLHHIGVFLFWRLVRWAKYAAIGAGVAAVSATALGSVASGAAVFLAPTTIVGSLGMGLVWMVGRFGFRKAAEKTRKMRGKGKHGDVGSGEMVDEGVPEPRFLEDTFA